MSDAATAPSRWTRLSGWVARSLGLGQSVTVPTLDGDKPIPAGAAYGTGLSTPPEYSPAGALRAVALDPWFHASVADKAMDLSTLPLYAEDKNGKRLKSHPVLDLLANPNGTRALSMTGAGTIAIRPTSWRELCEQWMVDLGAGGNAYGHVLIQNANAGPTALIWLPPTRVQPIANSLGSIAGYAVDDGGGFGGYANLPCATYGQSGIVSAHRFRARYDATDLSGMAPAAPLDAVISANNNASRRAAESSRKGRPDAIASPRAGSPPLTPQQIAQAESSLTKAFTAADQGVAVLSGSLELTPLSWSPKEMEEAERSAAARACTLAVTGVPPVRLGLETANYATAREQSTQYWRNIRGEAERIHGILDAIGACYLEPVRVRFDFGGVAPLQEDRGARLERVKSHIDNGLTPEAAYRLEGFNEVTPDMFASDPAEGGTDAPAGLSVAAQDLLDAIEGGDQEMIDAARAALDEALADGD
jgi:phage portal protein BeeE